LHCKLRIVPRIFKWTVCQNIDDEQLEEVRHVVSMLHLIYVSCMDIYANYFLIMLIVLT
jgi:hypothetical protein